MRFDHAAAATLAALSLLAAPTEAQLAEARHGPAAQPVEAPADARDAGLYEGVALVRVTPERPRHRIAVGGLDLPLAGEAVRVTGGTDYFATADQLGLLRDAGVPFEILHRNVQALVDAERDRIENRILPQTDEAFYLEYRPLDQLEARWSQIVSAATADVTRESIGLSVEGRELPLFRITAPGVGPQKPAVFFTAGVHAREWINPMTVTFIFESMATGYGVDPEITRLLDAIDLFIAPMVNPDGYLYSWSTDRFWRKNRRGGFGVDLNRNFSAGWGLGSSGNTASSVYRGPEPFSEPETRAVRDFAAANPQIAAHIDFHSFSQLILYPPNTLSENVPEPAFAGMQAVAVEMADEIFDTSGVHYKPIRGTDLYEAGGTTSGWFWGELGRFAWTFELRPSAIEFGGFDPHPDQIAPTAEEAERAARLLLRRVVESLRVALPGDDPFDGPGHVPPAAPFDLVATLAPAFTSLTLDPASPRLVTRIGDGAESRIPMTGAGSFGYAAPLPAAPCGEVITYRIEAELEGATRRPVRVPADGFEPYRAEVAYRSVRFEDNGETDAGWTVGAPGDTAVTGLWRRGEATFTGAQPAEDRSPVGNAAWYTDGFATSLGSNDVDGGSTTLTSPIIDATPRGLVGDASIAYWHWFSNDAGTPDGQDDLVAQISGDGGLTWVTMQRETETPQRWVFRRFRIADFVTPSDRVRVRFIATDRGDPSLVEAGIDDVRLEIVGCPASRADLATTGGSYGTLDGGDIAAFVNAFLTGDPLADLAETAGAYGTLDGNDIAAFISAFLLG